MVVVAVRDAETARAVPLPVRLLFAAGFALVCWFLGALSANFSAAADEPPPVTSTPHYSGPGFPGLLSGGPPATGLFGLLGTTATAMVGTVDQVSTAVGTVDQVSTAVGTADQVSTAVGTADQVTTAVGKVDQVTTAVAGRVANTVATAGTAVAAPITTILVLPAPVLAAEPAISAPRSDVATTASPRTVAEAAPGPAPQPVIREAAAPQQPVWHRQRPVRAPHPQAAAHTVEARGTLPAPASPAPGSQVCGIAVVYDGGSNSKHPPAILGGSTSVPRLRPAGVSRQDSCADTGRDQALPTTSPD
jgi:hypothetical protein